MKAAQAAGFLSIVAFLAGCVVVLSGQKRNLESLISPGDGAPEEAIANSAIGATQIAKAQSQLDVLAKEAIYINAGRRSVPNFRELRIELAESEPEIPLGKDLKDGGILMTPTGRSSVLFCAKPNFYFTCLALDIATRATGSGRGETLRGASSRAASSSNSKRSGPVEEELRAIKELAGVERER